MERNLRLDVRLNAAEKAQIEKAAERSGASLSAWIRIRLLEAAGEDILEAAHSELKSTSRVRKPEEPDEPMEATGGEVGVRTFFKEKHKKSK